MDNPLRLSETAVIEQCINGNREMYALLVGEYKDMIYNLAYRMVGDAETARDVAQESFITAYMSLKSFKHGSKFSSWLCSIAINKCRDHLRAKRERVSLDEITEEVATKTLNPEEAACQRQFGQRVQTVLNKLPQEYREAIILKHVEGLNYEEMKRILGVSVNALKVRTHRGRALLKRLLKEGGILDG